MTRQLLGDPGDGTLFIEPLKDLPHPLRVVLLDPQTAFWLRAAAFRSLFRIQQVGLLAVAVVASGKLAENATELPATDTATEFPNGSGVVQLHDLHPQLPPRLLSIDTFAGRNEATTRIDQVRNERECVIRPAQPRLVIDSQNNDLATFHHRFQPRELITKHLGPTFGLVIDNDGLGVIDPHTRERFAATIRFASQLNGLVAKALVFKRLGAHRQPRDEQTLTPEEEALLELRYGGSPALRNINLGLLFDCGPLFAELVNDFALAHVEDASSAEITRSAERLHQYIFLLGKFRRRRRTARAAERRDTRLSRSDHLPGGPRVDAQDHAEERTRTTDRREVLDRYHRAADAILPRLKPRDARRFHAVLDAHGDLGRAAESLGLDRETFGRQWRQTVKKNIGRVVADLAENEGFRNILSRANEDDEEEVET